MATTTITAAATFTAAASVNAVKCEVIFNNKHSNRIKVLVLVQYFYFQLMDYRQRYNKPMY